MTGAAQTRAILLPLLAGLALSGCRSQSGPRYVPRPGSDAGLPKAAAQQVALADRLVREQPRDLDALFRARQALERAHATKHEPFSVSWKLARACFLLARTLKNRQQRVEAAQRGIDGARSALTLDQTRVEPHYYLALNMAQIAEAESRLSLVKRMVAAAQRAAEIDPAYDGAGPLVFLGKVFLTAPAWPVSVGNVEKSVASLERALELAPRPLTRLFLGQAYYEDDREEQARTQLERALEEAQPGDIEPRWRKEADETLKALAGR